MTVRAGIGRRSPRLKTTLPPLPPGYVYLIDASGAYLTDASGNYLIGAA